MQTWASSYDSCCCCCCCCSVSYGLWGRQQQSCPPQCRIASWTSATSVSPSSCPSILMSRERATNPSRSVSSCCCCCCRCLLFMDCLFLLPVLLLGLGVKSRREGHAAVCRMLLLREQRQQEEEVCASVCLLVSPQSI